MITIIKDHITLADLQKMAEQSFGNLVKGVVDIEKKYIAFNGELHADEEHVLMLDGSKQEHLWGINIYPELGSEDWIEFDSMINLRPAAGNMSRGADDPKILRKIIAIVTKLVQ